MEKSRGVYVCVVGGCGFGGLKGVRGVVVLGHIAGDSLATHPSLEEKM